MEANNLNVAVSRMGPPRDDMLVDEPTTTETTLEEDMTVHIHITQEKRSYTILRVLYYLGRRRRQTGP